MERSRKAWGEEGSLSATRSGTSVKSVPRLRHFAPETHCCALGMIREAAKSCWQTKPRVNVVDLGAGDEPVDGRVASAALIVKPVNAAQRLLQQFKALIVGLFVASLARCWRNHACGSTVRARPRSWRGSALLRSKPVHLTFNGDRTSIRLIASVAIGALARQKNLRIGQFTSVRKPEVTRRSRL